MFEHIQILSYVLLILSATWLVFYIQGIYVKYPYGYLRAIRNYNIAVIFLFIIRLGFYYIRKNLLTELQPDVGDAVLNTISFSLSLLMIFMVYLMLVTLIKLRGWKFLLYQKFMIYALILLVVFVFIINNYFSDSSHLLLKNISQAFNNSLTFNLVINNLEFMLILFFHIAWKRSFRDKERKKLSKHFTLIYIICNSVSLLTLFLLMLVPMGEVLVWIIKVMVMCVFVIAPLIWISLVFIPYAQSMLKLINRTGNMQAIYMKHKISKREAEIIELILEGKGNNEIKDTLFISFHTVKNHLSNIFRKLKVRSRHELVHLFMVSGGDDMT